MNSPLILILIGLMPLGFGIFALMNAKFAENYARNSPKAWLWRKLLGVEGAVVAVRRVFAPLAVVIGVVIVVFGLRTLLTQ